MNKKMRQLFLLGCILLLAIFLRFYNLESVPKGFHIDEAIIADNAKFILHTGRDTNNNFLPLQTEVFGDYNPMGYAYLATIPIKIFGVNIVAARSVGALLSVLTVIAVFFLCFAIFEEINLSLLSAFLFAISPWDLTLSRSTEETVVALFFVVAGFATILWSVKKEKISYLLSGVFLLAISYFMYFTPRVFVPIFFIFLFYPWQSAFYK